LDWLVSAANGFAATVLGFADVPSCDVGPNFVVVPSLVAVFGFAVEPGLPVVPGLTLRPSFEAILCRIEVFGFTVVSGLASVSDFALDRVIVVAGGRG
jgi:hypothetical protein